MSAENKPVVRRPELNRPTYTRITYPRPKFTLLKALFATRQLVEKELDAYYRAYDLAKEYLVKDLEAKGLLGEHELIAPAKIERGLWGEIKGEASLRGFLLFVNGEAKLEGGIRSASSIQFVWRPKGRDEIIISEIPVDKFTIEKDESAETPRIQFTFNTEDLIKSDGYHIGDTTGFKVLSLPHPNDYLRGDRLANATLKIASFEGLSTSLPLPTKEKEL